ncbi:MAG: glycosyltransferase family 1 protein, partial [Alphaproteobacteria bacterium]
MKILLASDAWYPQINGVVRTLNRVREELAPQGHVFEVICPEQF